MSVLSAPYMQEQAAAFAHVEAMLWVDGPVCPYCGVVDNRLVVGGLNLSVFYASVNPGPFSYKEMRECCGCHE